MQIDQLRALDCKSRNDDRAGPTLSAFIRQINDQPELVTRNLRDAFPPAGSCFRRLAKCDESEQNESE